MVVTVLRIKKAKGAPAETVADMRLIAGIGIEGDANSGKATRQVCLISSPASAAREADGLCSPKFQANIETNEEPAAAWSTDAWSAGSRLRAGDAVLEIESVGKECYPECEAFRRAGPCSLALGCAFAKVTGSGALRVGDPVAFG